MVLCAWSWHSLYCNVLFLGIHNELSNPFFVLFCFFLSPPSPPSPLLLSLPPSPTGCAFVTFATRAMAQNAIKTMHHSQTMEVLYPLAPISHFPFPPTHTFCCPLVLKGWQTRWHQFCRVSVMYRTKSICQLFLIFQISHPELTWPKTLFNCIFWLK